MNQILLGLEVLDPTKFFLHCACLGKLSPARHTISGDLSLGQTAKRVANGPNVEDCFDFVKNKLQKLEDVLVEQMPTSAKFTICEKC